MGESLAAIENLHHKASALQQVTTAKKAIECGADFVRRQAH